MAAQFSAGGIVPGPSGQVTEVVLHAGERVIPLSLTNHRRRAAMFALVAAVILLLHGVGVLDNSEDANWLYIGLSAWALHFAVSLSIPFPRTNP